MGIIAVSLALLVGAGLTTRQPRSCPSCASRVRGEKRERSRVGRKTERLRLGRRPRLLFGVRATDAGSFLRAVVVVLAGVLLATVVPAWRASRTNPVSALRHQ